MGSLSRRSFLKLCGSTILSLGLAPIAVADAAQPDQQGRVLNASIHLHARPSFQSQVLDTYYKDMVLSITEATIGDTEPPYNRVWYKIGEKGFVHSGAVQPVRTVLNPPVSDIPEKGALAEVTVPFTDAHWKPDKSFPVAYRFYYETTHWVKRLVYDELNQPWYHLVDDRWDESYYVPAQHLRIVPYDELTPLSPHVPATAKRIEVRTAEQVVIAYEWDQPVFMARAATGARFSNGNFATPAGLYITNYKRAHRHMVRGNLAFNGYDLPGVPWVTFITESGISFHGTYWHNNYGRPRSHGCINLTPQAAKWIYRWTLPVVPPEQPEIFKDYGTLVEVM